VAHIPEDLLQNNWVSGVKLTYDNAIKILHGLGISQIATIGETPDMEIHDPLSVEPVEDETLKGKIIKEFQAGYVYEKDGIKKVISAAKVIVGQ
jgi:molecular chaperone GrpE (heat shock protein)